MKKVLLHSFTLDKKQICICTKWPLFNGWHVVRVVKEADSKSARLRLRRFKSCTCRNFYVPFCVLFLRNDEKRQTLLFGVGIFIIVHLNRIFVYPQTRCFYCCFFRHKCRWKISSHVKDLLYVIVIWLSNLKYK